MRVESPSAFYTAAQSRAVDAAAMERHGFTGPQLMARAARAAFDYLLEQTGEPELLRGSEWYVFREGRIAEIRSYHNNFYLQNAKNRELHDFDYAGRGYRLDI